MIDGSLDLSIKNGIANLQFSHHQSNALPSVLLHKLINTIQLLDKNAEVKIIILQSGGAKTFCAGASFDELLALKNQEESIAFFSGFAHLLNAMRLCSKLIIGRIQGKAVGGGVGIIAACDFTFATESASIKLSELSIGIGPFVIEPAVSRKIGLAAFSELCLLATTWKSAHWAKEKGLYAEVFPTLKALDAALVTFTKNLSTYHILALAELKKVFWQNTSHWQILLLERAAISGKLALSDETKQALKKFKSPC
ncbi:MAG: enoyl-CoA hydratase [Flavobacteriales bacterium CG_4_8_14_3_um_filter_35_10]|nr:enoyl-CoA hydratase/isomerase family protein [Zetaproteobacteria bacterium]OIO12476.1 MAG: enoyl-CoA hydratase [Flavobacteriaceae bacterium CG1_02_35_72]PIR12307.1 MAG: enoyl-CoA hydratase [Flavobacteriales bacterium CG11_big_fil_rev_8_21_14_0_20_35_7]PIX07147.1 MAG: enoyl-CoA hydratase [Flavobacteriales bacterium CG_4_8_14_3_um_filter_35_10]